MDRELQKHFTWLFRVVDNKQILFKRNKLEHGTFYYYD